MLDALAESNRRIAFTTDADGRDAVERARRLGSSVTPEELAEAQLEAIERGDVPPRWFSERFGEVEAASPEELQAAAGVPDALREALRGYRPAPALVAYGVELRGPRARGAWIVGDSSSLASAWCAGLVPNGRFVDCPDLLSDLGERGLFGPDGGQALANALKAPALLVIDSPDAARWSSQDVKCLWPVLRHRRRHGLPTVVSARTSLPDFGDRLVGSMRTDEARQEANRLVGSLFGGMGESPEERDAHVMDLINES